MTASGQGTSAPARPTSDPQINSLTDLFAVAWRIEADAVERYTALAARMRAADNRELADVFGDLARAESIHRDEIKRLAGDVDVEAHARALAGWEQGESPEVADLRDIDLPNDADLGDPKYRITPWHALKMALAGEQRALAYFERVRDTADDPKILDMAKEFAEEETDHVTLCQRLLRKYPAPAGA